MNQSILSLSWGLLTSKQGEERAQKSPLGLPFLTHFFLHVLSPSFAHLFPILANTFSTSEASPCLFFPQSVSVSAVFLHHHPRSLSCGAFVRRKEGRRRKERRREWVPLFRTDGILCLSGGQNVPARVLLMLNGTGRWIIPCAALSLDKFKGSPTTGHHGRIGSEGGLACIFLLCFHLYLFSFSAFERQNAVKNVFSHCLFYTFYYNTHAHANTVSLTQTLHIKFLCLPDI